MVTEHWVFDSSYYWTKCRRRHVNNKRHSLAVRHSNHNSKNAGSNPAGALVFQRMPISADFGVLRITTMSSGELLNIIRVVRGSNPVDINVVKSSTSEILRALFATRHHRIMENNALAIRETWVRFPMVSSGR